MAARSRLRHAVRAQASRNLNMASATIMLGRNRRNGALLEAWQLLNVVLVLCAAAARADSAGDGALIIKDIRKITD